MLSPDTLLKSIGLETITPAEALAFVQKLTAETLDTMSSDYYVRWLKAAGMVVEAATGNQRRQNGRKGCLCDGWNPPSP